MRFHKFKLETKHSARPRHVPITAGEVWDEEVKVGVGGESLFLGEESLREGIRRGEGDARRWGGEGNHQGPLR